MASSRNLLRSMLPILGLFVSLACQPLPSMADDFVPAVPDSPLSIQGMELSAFGGDASAVPGDRIQLAQLVPMELHVQCDPASASMGIDCGMPEMCGLDPCLCGSADSWGACSCNGYEECVPSIACTAQDPGIVSVESRNGSIFLRAAGTGSTTVKVRATMPHHTESSAEFIVESGPWQTADFAHLGILVLAVALIGAVVTVVVIAIRKRRPSSMPPAAPLVLLALTMVSGLGLVGCSSPSVSEDSPRIQEVTLRPSSDMTEGSQKAEIRLVFDRPVSISGNALDDLELLMNGAPLDGSTMAVNAQPNATGLTIALTPASGAMGVGKGSFFALYQADLDLRSKRDDGVIPSITGADGSAAVLDQPVKGTFPSGMVLEEIEVIRGSETSGQTAQTTFRVASAATIRAVTWFSPDGGQTKLLKHNHTFMDASAEDCAEDLAKVINGASGLGVVATAQGDTVVMRASAPVEGQELHPVLIEGIGAEGGAFVPLSD